MPSVTHLLAPAPFGGLESVVATLVVGQARAGQDVSVIGVFDREPGDDPFWESLRETGVERIALVVGARGYARERRSVRGALLEQESRVLHTHGYRPDVVDAGVGRRLGLATVTTVHGFTGGGWRNRAYEWVQRRAFRRFDAVVAVSSDLRGELIRAGVPSELVHTLPNAWEPRDAFLSRSEARAALGLGDAERVVGWVGRLTSEKAPDVMLEAFLRVDDPCARLSFVGAGPMRESLACRAASSDVGARVHWHGTLARASRYLAAFDVVAITSHTEGTPMVLLEAMAAGVPIVATRVGGIPDVVSDEEAWLVPRADPAAVAARLRAVLGGGDDVRRRVERARERVARDRAVMPWVEAYGSIYRACLLT